MQALSIILLLLWLIYANGIYQSDKDFGRINAIVDGGLLGLIFSIGTVAFMVIILTLLKLAVGG